MSRETNIQIRRGSSTEWTSANPTLSNGEIAIETNTKKLKVGNGSAAWNNLKYVGADAGNLGINFSGSGTAARTLYWSASGDDSWYTLSAWYLDEERTIQADSLPTVHDTAVILAYMDQNTPPVPTIANLLVASNASFLIDIIVTGTATFTGNSFYGFYTLTGNAVFNDSSVLFDGTIDGDAVFNDITSNCGTVTGTVTVNGTLQQCP